jgi:hypothetical protein
MPLLLYNYHVGRAVPLLTDEEFEPIGEALGNRIRQIQEYRKKHNCSLEEARARSADEAMDLYEELTGVRLDHPDQLHRVRLSEFGPPCPRCGKPFRTRKAKYCAECGFRPGLLGRMRMKRCR